MVDINLSISADMFKGKKQPIYLYIIETFLILCALFCKIQVIPHDGTEVPFLALLVKFRESFMEPYGIELILGGAIFALFYFLDVLDTDNKGKRHLTLILLSGVFAFIYVYCRSLITLDDGSFLYANGYQRFLSALCIVGYWLLFHLALRWAYYLLSRVNIEVQDGLNYKRMWLFSFIGMIVCWLPWIFASYPATFSPDAIWQVGEIYGVHPWSIKHVPLSTAIIGACVILGDLILNRTLGIFIYIIMQTLCGAAVFSYLLVTLRKMGCSKRVFIAGFLFYAIFPLVPVYAQWFEKDFLYVVFFTLSMILLIKTLHEGSCLKKRACFIAFAIIMTSLLRSNGKFEIFPFFALLCLVMKKGQRKALFISLLVSLTVVFGANNILYPALNMRSASEVELLAIPMQQTARYLKYAPEEVTDEEEAAISAVMDFDNLAKKYMPTLFDPIKGLYNSQSEGLKEYLRAWLQMGQKRPDIYTDAFIYQAYGYLAPVKTEGEPPVKYSRDYEEVAEIEVFRIANVVPTALMDTIWIIMQRLPGVKLLATAGFYTWFVFSCSAFLLVKKRYYAMLPLIPGIINAFLCVASSMSASIRYDLQVAVTMPLLLWWTAYNLSPAVKKKEENI